MCCSCTLCVVIYLVRIHFYRKKIHKNRNTQTNLRNKIHKLFLNPSTEKPVTIINCGVTISAIIKSISQNLEDHSKSLATDS